MRYQSRQRGAFCGEDGAVRVSVIATRVITLCTHLLDNLDASEAVLLECVQVLLRIRMTSFNENVVFSPDPAHPVYVPFPEPPSLYLRAPFRWA